MTTLSVSIDNDVVTATLTFAVGSSPWGLRAENGSSSKDFSVSFGGLESAVASITAGVVEGVSKGTGVRYDSRSLGDVVGTSDGEIVSQRTVSSDLLSGGFVGGPSHYVVDNECGQMESERTHGNVVGTGSHRTSSSSTACFVEEGSDRGSIDVDAHGVVKRFKEVYRQSQEKALDLSLESVKVGLSSGLTDLEEKCDVVSGESRKEISASGFVASVISENGDSREKSVVDVEVSNIESARVVESIVETVPLTSDGFAACSVVVGESEVDVATGEVRGKNWRRNKANRDRKKLNRSLAKKAEISPCSDDVSERVGGIMYGRDEDDFDDYKGDPLVVVHPNNAREEYERLLRELRAGRLEATKNWADAVQSDIDANDTVDYVPGVHRAPVWLPDGRLLRWNGEPDHSFKARVMAEAGKR